MIEQSLRGYFLLLFLVNPNFALTTDIPFRLQLQWSRCLPLCALHQAHDVDIRSHCIHHMGSCASLFPL